MIGFSGQVWRILPLGADPLAPATAPEGRFHHSGQRALYCSLTPEGTVVAIRRYLRAGDGPRVIQALTISALRLVDLRGRPDVSVVWQDSRSAGAPAPTWAFSDAARAAGAEGMLYSSRSRPDLSHLVLFDDPAPLIRSLGAPLPAAPFLRS